MNGEAIVALAANAASVVTGKKLEVRWTISRWLSVGGDRQPRHLAGGEGER